MNDTTTTPTAPAPTAAEAQTRISDLRRDPGFTAKWASGDADARQEMARLHEAAYPGVTNLTPQYETTPSAPTAPTSSEQAQARIAALRKDPAWVAKWTAGDANARAELARLTEAAFPGETSLSGDVQQEASAEDITQWHQPARPEQFEMPSLLEHPDAPITPEIRAMDQAFRGVLAEAMFDKPTGSYVAKEVGRALEKTRDMDEDAFSAYAAGERAKLERIWKGDFNRKLGLAKQLVGELEERTPGVTELLRATGAGSSANVLVQLAAQAEILLARQGGK